LWQHADFHQINRSDLLLKNWVNRLLGTKKTASASAQIEPPPRAKQPDAHLTPDEWVQVCADLDTVLNQHANSRQVMRYVAMLERAFQKKGRKVIEVLPIELVRKALEQLNTLGAHRELAGISLLRSKAAISIAQREYRMTQRDQLRRQAEREKIHVEDATHSEFMFATDEWERSFTGTTSPAPLDALPIKTQVVGDLSKK
jgi:hypothetical protein